MNPRAQKLFEDVVDLSSEQRERYLAEACKGDDGLRREVESLLRSNEQASDFFGDPTITLSNGQSGGSGPDQSGQASTLAGLGEKPGDTIGRYKLIEQLGEGGFGVVFLAEQTEPVKRRVALKIIREGLGEPERVARFDAERQALALMDHPNIARVYDGGATASGRLYFVMELVEGMPITSYCDRTNLGVEARLQLFRHVCSAVQHAHQKGIIHRDIKPSNVLVTVIDGQPVAKVIDFGIAKAVNVRLTDRTLFTQTRQVIGTPEYMSPEQADNTSKDIDTRTDVYSLGVLLYELLTGVTPFDFSHAQTIALEEMLRMIRVQEPVKPSLRLSKDSTAASAASGSSALRKPGSRKLESTLRGDLDWIVMRCLEKDRTRRYETAQSLSEDVQRYLAREPVLAGPPSAVYRMRKFYSRHRGGVLAAASIFVLATGSAVALAVQNVRIAEQRDDSRTAQAAAQTASESFGLTLITRLNSTQGTEALETMWVPLKKGDQRMSALNFDRLPELKYNLLKQLAICYESLGDTPAADAKIERLLEVSEAAGSTPSQSLQDIAEAIYEQTQAQSKAGNLQAADEMSRRAVKHLEAAQDSTSVLYGKVHASAAAAMMNNGGSIAEGMKELLAMAAFLDSKHPEANAARGDTRYNLAGTLRSMRQAERALGEANTAFSHYKAAHTDDPAHPDIIDVLGLLVLIHTDRKDPDEVCKVVRAIVDRVSSRAPADSEHASRLQAFAAIAYSGEKFELNGKSGALRSCLPEGLEGIVGAEIDAALIATPRGNSNICETMLTMRMLSAARGDRDDEERWATRAYEMCHVHDDWPDDVTRRSRALLCKIYVRGGRHVAAVSMYKDWLAFENRKAASGKIAKNSKGETWIEVSQKGLEDAEKNAGLKP